MTLKTFNLIIQPAWFSRYHRFYIFVLVFYRLAHLRFVLLSLIDYEVFLEKRILKCCLLLGKWLLFSLGTDYTYNVIILLNWIIARRIFKTSLKTIYFLYLGCITKAISRLACILKTINYLLKLFFTNWTCITQIRGKECFSDVILFDIIFLLREKKHQV